MPSLGIPPPPSPAVNAASTITCTPSHTPQQLQQRSGSSSSSSTRQCLPSPPPPPRTHRLRFSPSHAPPLTHRPAAGEQQQRRQRRSNALAATSATTTITTTHAPPPLLPLTRTAPSGRGTRTQALCNPGKHQHTPAITQAVKGKRGGPRPRQPPLPPLLLRRQGRTPHTRYSEVKRSEANDWGSEREEVLAKDMWVDRYVCKEKESKAKR